MKKPTTNYAIMAVLFALALSPLSTIARAELVSEEVQENAITPEEGADASSDDIVIVNKPAARPAPRRASTRRMVRREMQEQPAAEPVALQEPAMEVQTVTRAQVAAPAPMAAAQPERKSVGSTVDQTIQNKMDGVREQFEQALVRQLDKIKITVADDTPAPQAPVQTTVVADNVITNSAAPEKANYMSIDAAPAIADEEALAGKSEAKSESSDSSGNFRLAPVIGMTSIGSSVYDISSKYTAGVNLEIEMDNNLAIVLGYTYSQYDIGLLNANSLYNPMQPQLTSNGNLSTLSYNQNVFDGGLRIYLMPKESRFRAHVGAGLGYNKGYVNYKTQTGYTYAYNPYQNQPDYEVNSFLGVLEAGAEFKVSKTVSVGGLFKYDQVLSSRENQPLNNYAFINNGFGTQPITDKQVVGGSIAKENFYSILGTVKVSF